MGLVAGRGGKEVMEWRLSLPVDSLSLRLSGATKSKFWETPINFTNLGASQVKSRRVIGLVLGKPGGTFRVTPKPGISPRISEFAPRPYARVTSSSYY